MRREGDAMKIRSVWKGVTIPRSLQDVLETAAAQRQWDCKSLVRMSKLRQHPPWDLGLNKEEKRIDLLRWKFVKISQCRPENVEARRLFVSIEKLWVWSDCVAVSWRPAVADSLSILHHATCQPIRKLEWSKRKPLATSKQKRKCDNLF